MNKKLKNWLETILRIFVLVLVGSVLAGSFEEIIRGTISGGEIFQFVFVCIIIVLWFTSVINSYLEMRKRINISNEKVNFEEKSGNESE